MKSRIIWTTYIAVLIAAQTSATWAVLLDSSSFDHRYEGDVLPATGTSTAFTENVGDGAVWSPTTDGINLSFRNTIANGGGFFRNNEWNSSVNNTVGWTIEWRVKIGTDFDDDPVGGAFQVFAKENLSSNSTRRVTIAVGQDFTSIASLAVPVVLNHDNTDSFHVFRVAQPANSSDIMVWRDGSLLYNGVSRGTNNTGVDMYFGDGSSGAGGSTVLLDYFRWDDDGPFEPVPIPEVTSFMLVGLGMIGVVACCCRRRIEE